jgi:flavin-dependent dehydrogenase
MDQYDVIVVGAGLAGLQSSRLLAEDGFSVLLVDRKPTLSYGIHTTGIFVRRTLEHFDLPEKSLGPPIRRVTLYSPRGVPLHLESPHAEFRIGRMGLLYGELLRRCRAAGVRVLLETSYAGCRAAGNDEEVSLQLRNETWPVQARFVIGADGACSRVAADLGLSRNRRWIVGVENVLRGVREVPGLHCFLDPKLAPGYLAWVACDGAEAHLGVGGHPDRFRPLEALKQFRRRAAESLDLANAEFVEHRSGRIPIGGVLRQLVNQRGLLVGDAAGAVSPLTAGGLDGCLRLSELAAEVAGAFLRTGDPRALACYDGAAMRARFRRRQLLRFCWDRMRSPWMMEGACTLLRQPVCRQFAERVFFGPGSFPDMRPLAQGVAKRRVRVPAT